MSEMDEIVREFLIESREGLDKLDRDLVALEQRPGDRELLAGIFRCIHTIKGTCGFLGFAKLEAVSHVGENLLSMLRDGRLALDPEITSVLLRLVDAVRQILACIEADSTEGAVKYDELIAVMTGLAEETQGRRDGGTRGDESAPVTNAATSGTSPSSAPSASSASTDANIRVDVTLLDQLMNLVGELVLARNQILQFSGALNDAAFLSTTQRLDHITTELQEGVMKTRMQPIGTIWSKFPRVVRDLAVSCGKQVAIEMDGRETELDKTIIEAIKDPLTHIVRNSVDHGLESPEVRLANGKPAEGKLSLRAYHESGQVNIEIADDGAGINADRVKLKAIERGLISAEQAGRMGERELQHLIFLPGFSTAERVTNVSGRGVGMDVVRTNIEKIGGTVDIHSVQGRGTTLRIKIPLTLAIIPALTVTVDGDRYAIPQVSLLELVRAATGIEMFHGAPVYRLRGTLLPLVHLDRQLGLVRARDADDAANIVVVEAGSRPFGLVVDEINDTEEIVVKPLGKLLKGLPVFAGATIMGDGRVALILDVMGLAQRANVVAAGAERARPLSDSTVTPRTALTSQTLLVFSLGNGYRTAIPLSLVARLEELPRDAVETSVGQEVAQYRGQILPLLRLSRVLDLPGRDEGDGPLQVIVYADRGHRVGLVVDCIVDIVEESLQVERPVEHRSVLGSSVIQERVTDLLDVQAIVRRAHPAWFAESADAA